MKVTRSKPKLLVRIIAALAVLFTAWHVFAQFLWIAPASQLRTLIPGNVLTDYQIPLFGQSWSVFAPDPINGDYTLKLRAITTDAEGNAGTTDWVDATNAEYKLSKHNLFPPRAAQLAVEQASRFKNAYDALNQGQKDVAGLGFYTGNDWQQRHDAGIRKAAGNDPVAIQAAEKFISEARHTDAYVTQAAEAVWGRQVTFVQYEIYRQNIVPFAERFNDAAVRPDKQMAPTGWRGLYTYDGQSSSDFSSVFAPIAEKESSR